MFGDVLRDGLSRVVPQWNNAMNRVIYDVILTGGLDWGGCELRDWTGGRSGGNISTQFSLHNFH